MRRFHVLEHHRLEVIKGDASVLAAARANHLIELVVVVIVAQCQTQLVLGQRGGAGAGGSGIAPS